MSPRKSGTIQRNNPNRPQRPRCVIASPKQGEGLFQRNHIHRNKVAGDGVSTYLALTFGTLLSSQGTEAAIGNRFRFPSGLSLRGSHRTPSPARFIIGFFELNFGAPKNNPMI